MSNTNLYGFFSELLGLESKVSLVNCDSVLNWTTRINRGQIFLESGMKVEGEASIRLQNNMSAFEEWIYTPSAPWNLSSYRYLGAWIHSTGGGPQWALFLTDSSGNENYYRIYLSTFDRETETYSPSFTGWKRVLIPIEDYYGALNLSSITQLRMITGFQLPVDILVDDIFVFGHVGEESLVSADYIEGAVDIGLGNIEIENMSSGLDTTVIANYTQDSVPVAPFALQKEFGNGTVTYLNINLLYQYLISESYGIFSPHEIFIKILEIIGVQRLP